MEGETTRPARSRAFYLAHLIAALKTSSTTETPAPLPLPALTPAAALWTPSPGFVPLGFSLAVPA